ncbi:MAG: phosphate signaling complex protein PhoU [Anaerolineae bacterium]|nr:phosphate signaling complex protein PhoU [Anaerolineae bacterium]
MTPLRSLLHSELERIRDDVSRMGDMVERATLQAVEALVDGDVELAQQIIDGDLEINQLRFDIEAACFMLLATQQPAAIDLRTVVTALNIITELERIGDYAKGIGQIVVATEGQELVMPPQKTVHMAQVVCEMMHIVLEAFIEGDTEAAQRVCDMDDDVDHMYRDVFESILQAMVAREHGVREGMHLLFAAHNLERMGDRVTNIGERVIFMQTGVMQERNW